MRIITAVLLIVLLFLIDSCSVYKTAANLTRLKFRLGNVSSLRISDISVSGKSRLSDFSAQEIIKITSAVSRGTLPVSFVLNVNAKNPNDGTGGYPRTNANIKSFPWRLLINEKETVSGNINSPVYVPGTGEETVFPLQLNFDLMRFFKNRSLDEIVNLALNIGGYGGNSSRLELYAQPTVSSPLGDIRYPQEIRIVEYEYNR